MQWYSQAFAKAFGGEIDESNGMTWTLHTSRVASAQSQRPICSSPPFALSTGFESPVAMVITETTDPAPLVGWITASRSPSGEMLTWRTRFPLQEAGQTSLTLTRVQVKAADDAHPDGAAA